MYKENRENSTGCRVSVIICTFNGSKRIERLKEFFLNQSFINDWEVLIVNNASDKENSLRLLQIQQEWSMHFSCNLIDELKIGLNNARQTGINNSKGSLIIFCDDDNWLAPDFLQRAWDFYNDYPQAGAFGGAAFGLSDVPLPEWFNEVQHIYACGQKYKETTLITDKSLLWGAGLCLRKEVARMVFAPGHPMLLTDRSGATLSSGGDDEICYRVLLAGYQLYYVPALVLQHFMEPHRLTPNYCQALQAGFKYQSEVISAYYRCRQVQLGKVKLLTQFAAYLLYSLLGRPKHKAQAAEFLYYRTGIAVLGKAHSKAIRNYFQSVNT